MTMTGAGPAFAGRHCETTAAGTLLRHAGIELSEPMLFGLGRGLGFVYWDGKYLDFPFLGGRVRPYELTTNLAAALGGWAVAKETSSARVAWANVRSSIDEGMPVGLQLDCYHLEYFGTKVHFGGHCVAMVGYDDTHAYLVDTAQQGGSVKTTLDSLALARSARGPMTARNRSYTFTGVAVPGLGSAAVQAIRANAAEFLDPPIRNLGYRGIAKAADLVPGWFSRSADPAEHLTRTADLMERGGTGGALFRRLYTEFLAECLAYVDDDNLRRGHDLYRDIVPLWSLVADRLAEAGRTGRQADLDEAAATLRELSERERAAMRVLSAVTERPGSR